MERLFLALWPDDVIRARLEATQRLLPHGIGRPTPGANLHLTLVFLGNVDAARRACVRDVCGRIRAATIEIVFDEIRCHARTGVAWASARVTPPPLSELAGRLQTALLPCQYRPEVRPFRAHVTLARAMRRRVTLALPEPIVWTVQEFCLVASTLSIGGARYAVQRCWPLGG